MAESTAIHNEIHSEMRPSGEGRAPVEETENSVSYLGVRLEKARAADMRFVPSREAYQDYINDRFSTELQRDIAISLSQGQPIIIEGGTSLGKTTTVRKMASDLGWEVHYANLNGATDVEDLMGRYIPNPNKHGPEDPEYVFADGKVTSGLRVEEGKRKLIILDEYNAAAPNILIRLHEVLDALGRDENVVLAEDASEAVQVDSRKTSVVALMNPPGKGYFGREPLDPAQLRRWNYLKAPTELPEETFSFSTDALFSLAPTEQQTTGQTFINSRDQRLLPDQLPEIPGIDEILAKYKEFHKAAKQMVKERTVASDQPQPFTYDDRMEPKRVRDFLLTFYNGDLTETFQHALRYYYVNKVESDEDRAKLEEIVQHVEYIPPVTVSNRKGLEREKKGRTGEFTPEQRELLEKLGGKIYTLNGKSISELREEGLEFSTSWHNDQPIETLASLTSEVAIPADILNSTVYNEKAPFVDQQRRVAKLSETFANKVPGTKTIIGSAADYINLHAAFREANKGIELFSDGFENIVITESTRSSARRAGIVNSINGIGVITVNDSTTAEYKVLPLIIPEDSLPVESEIIQSEKEAWRAVLGVKVDVPPLPSFITPEIQEKLENYGFELRYIPDLNLTPSDSYMRDEDYFNEILLKFPNWNSPYELSDAELHNPDISRTLPTWYWARVKSGDFMIPSGLGKWAAIETVEKPKSGFPYKRTGFSRYLGIDDRFDHTFDQLKDKLNFNADYFLTDVGLAGKGDLRMLDILEYNLLGNREKWGSGTHSEFTNTHYYGDVIATGGDDSYGVASIEFSDSRKLSKKGFRAGIIFK